VRRRARRAAFALAVVCAGLAVWSAAAGGRQQPPPARTPSDAALARRGRDLYAGTCATCHGENLRGVPGRGPALLRGGAAAADFYLSTGRMPIADPTDEPSRAEPQMSGADIAALVAYVGSFGDLPQRDLDDVAAYVRYTAHPDDRGGWGIGNIGPVPEGMVTWLLAAVALLGIVRALGERAP